MTLLKFCNANLRTMELLIISHFDFHEIVFGIKHINVYIIIFKHLIILVDCVVITKF